jgi:glycosyltransferase involved in cell wall biosynthesis
MLCSQPADFNLIIKDDCSPRQKEIQAIVERYKDKVNFDLSFHRNPSNLGYDKNLLDAFNITDSDYVFLLSDDDYIDGAYMGELSKSLSKRINKIYFTPYNHDGVLNRFNIKPYRLSEFHEVIYNSILFSGLIFDRLTVLSMIKDEEFLSNCIYTQVYLSSIIIYNEKKFGELTSKLLYLGGDGENFFGKNQSAINKDILQDRSRITSNLNYQVLLFKVVDKISDVTHPSVFKIFKKQYNLRLIGYLLKARISGLDNFKLVVNHIKKLNIHTDWRVRLSSKIILLFPEKICNAAHKLAVRLLRKSG